MSKSLFVYFRQCYKSNRNNRAASARAPTGKDLFGQLIFKNKIKKQKPKLPSDFRGEPPPLSITRSLIRNEHSLQMMNQFECVSPVPDRTTQSATISTPSSSLSELLNMQPETQSFRSLTTHTHSFCISNANNNKNSNKNNNHRLMQRSKSLVSESFGRQRSIREGQILSVDHREVMIYDIVGNGISGILYKWVNYGRGWRPRWFVLQDGVLSYFKIHGPDRITLNLETERGSMVIGGQSFRRLSRNTRAEFRLRKPVAELHLKVGLILQGPLRFSAFKHCFQKHSHDSDLSIQRCESRMSGLIVRTKIFCMRSCEIVFIHRCVRFGRVSRTKGGSR